MSSATTFKLRPVTAADDAFLRSLFFSVRSAELAAVPWTDEQKTVFLSSQFDAQHKHYITHYPDAAFDVIEIENTPIGRITVYRSDSIINLMDVALIPSHQNLGIGTRMITALVDEAEASDRIVQLHVENFNRAKRLYERLGFICTAEDAVYCTMEWRKGHMGVAPITKA